MYSVQGIDTSKWEGAIDWGKAFAHGASFAYLKASEYVADPLFASEWKKSKGILPRGAYHFIDWNWSELDQANLFIKTMNGDWGELPPVLDLEAPPLVGMPPALVRGKVWNFLQAIEKASGRIPMIYSGYSYWNQWGSTDAGWLKYPFWLAWYEPEWYVRLISRGTGAPKPWKNWTIWQNLAKADGLAFGCMSKEVDHNFFNGSLADFNKFVSGSPLPLPNPTPLPDNLYYASSAINVRESPDYSSRLLRVLPAGEQIHVIGSVTNGYIRIIEGGWVYSAYLKKA